MQLTREKVVELERRLTQAIRKAGEINTQTVDAAEALQTNVTNMMAELDRQIEQRLTSASEALDSMLKETERDIRSEVEVIQDWIRYFEAMGFWRRLWWVVSGQLTRRVG